MKKILSSLPVRLIIGVVIGIIIGLGSADLWIGGTDVGGTIMQVVLTLKNLLGSLINFCVPLIIIGFIAPSITRLRSNASRMLVLALALAYTSSVCAALMSMGAGYAIIPGLSIQSAAEGLREAPELLFNLDIAPVMSVMSALVFSVLVGLAATWTRAKVITQVLEEFQRVEERCRYLTEQKTDVEQARKELETVIDGITQEMEAIFRREFARVQGAFAQTFADLFGGGRGQLALEDERDVLQCGIEIKAQPPGKSLKTISLLSGGEKAFVAIALYFAILKVRPTPFCVMDEIEAALDEANGARFIRYLGAVAAETQFLLITHRRETMEAADVLYGVTMERQGVSRVLKLDLRQAEELLGSHPA